MNRELNVFTLRMLRDQYHAEHLDTEAEALEAAISALEDTDSAYAEGWTAAESKYRAMMSDGDCISRQAAIDALGVEPCAFSEYEEGLHTMWADAKEAIEALPSAQPEPQWIPCSECINYIDERCVVANHHVSEKENCMEVFGAKRRTVERRRA